MKKRKKTKKYGITWTKRITQCLLVIGVLNGTIPFLLSFLGKSPCVEMGIAWVTEVVAVSLGYFVRGFKDTKEEEKVRLEEKRMESEVIENLNMEDKVYG